MVDRVALKRDARNMRMGKYYRLMFPIAVSIGIGLVFSLLTGLGGSFSQEWLIAISTILTSVVGIFITYLNAAYFRAFSLTGDPDNRNYFKRIKSPQHALKIFCTNIVMACFIMLGFICFLIPGIYLSFCYSQVQYILSEKEDVGVMEALRLSKDMMRGYIWDYFVFCLSFIGWFILGAFTFGIMYLWIFSYFETAKALYYGELRADFESRYPGTFSDGHYSDTYDHFGREEHPPHRDGSDLFD